VVHIVEACRQWRLCSRRHLAVFALWTSMGAVRAADESMEFTYAL
jgi:hypothetical protein